MDILINLLLLINCYLHNRCQRITLNGHSSDWVSVQTIAPQGSILGPCFFCFIPLTYMSRFQLKLKFFADDMSMFSIHDLKLSAINLNEDLKTISEMAILGKMSFNPK